MGAAVVERGLETLALTPVIIIIPICSAVHMNPLMQTTAKNSLIFWRNLLEKSFEGEMLIRTLPATLLHIFCKIILNSNVISKLNSIGMEYRKLTSLNI